LQGPYELVAVADGQSALESARQHPPDLVLADVMMPRLDGFGLLRELRADQTLNGIPVLLVSARAGEESRIEGLAAGADDYLVKPFSARELVARVGSQLAMARVRREAADTERKLRAEAEAEAEALVKLNKWSGQLWRSRSLKEGLDEMLAAAINLLNAQKGNIQMLEHDHLRLTIGAQRGFGKEFLDFFRQVTASDDSACGRALRAGERVIVEDVEADESFAPLRPIARRAGFKAVISTPLIGADGTFLGVLSIHFGAAHRPSKADLQRLDLYVRQATDFIQRCRIEEALRRSEEQFRKLSETLDAEVRARTKELEERNNEVLRQSERVRAISGRLLRAQDEERRRIARELHDSAGQTLTVLGMDLAQFVQKAGQNVPELTIEAEAIQEMVQQLHREIRTTSYLLHPPLLDQVGLYSALSWYTQGLTERSGLEINLDISEEFGRLPRDMELVVFRLVQESLTNIHRHSGSMTASIRIAREENQVTVDIQDEGHGMSAERLFEIQSGSSSVGIPGMRERLRQFEGEMKIESDSSGTRIFMTIPALKTEGSEGDRTGESLKAAI
jgi:signal transduction histidine kinase/response regulator of citrate/malate metabolism